MAMQQLQPMVPLGVLKCFGCSYRVTGSNPQYYCCAACCSSPGTHGAECKRVPLEGLPPGSANSASSSSRDPPDAGRVEYRSRLHRLLMQHNGCLHFCSIPVEWDRLYGPGSWAECRPVKKVEKACLPPYTDNVEVMDCKVYALEAMPPEDRAKGRPEIVADIDGVKELAVDVQKLINVEFLGASSGKIVRASFARCPDHEYARCRLQLCPAASAEGSEEGSSAGESPAAWLAGESSSASSAAMWLGALNDAASQEAVDAPQVIEVEVLGFGEELDQALLNAKRHLLERLGRWVDLPDPRVQRIIDLDANLKEMQSVVEEAVQPSRELDSYAFDGVRACMEALLDRIEEILSDPPPCLAAMWSLFARAWPHIVCTQDQEYLRRVISLIHRVGQHPPLSTWVQLAEAAAWSMFFPALEPLEEMQVAEDTPAVRYVRYHLFSLLLEQRAQLQQEYHRLATDHMPQGAASLTQEAEKSLPSSSNFWPNSQRACVQVRWEAGHNGWYGCFDSAALAPLLGNSRGVALLLTSPEDTASSVFCEVLDEGRALLRGIPGLMPLLHLLRTERPCVQVLPSYLVVHARMREAVQSLLFEDGNSWLDVGLRSIIVDTWGMDRDSEEGAEAIRRGADLAGQRPDIEGLLPPASLSLPHGVSPPPPPPPPGGGPTASESLSAVLQEWPALSLGGQTCSELIAAFTPAQRQAVSNALSRRLSLVRGPPGTGKTHVAAAIIAAASSCKQYGTRILAVTQSNAAALNLHRRLEVFGVRAARIGTTLTPSEVLEQRVVDVIRSRDPDDQELQVLERATGCLTTSASLVSCAPSPTVVQHAQFTLMHRLAREADAIVMTCASSGNRGLLRNIGPFPLLVLDEAAQCIEPGALVPLGLGCQALAAVGDEKQLPATVLDRRAAARGLGCSLFERCVRDGVVAWTAGFVQLDEQHRMHPSIAEFPSVRFYDCQEGGIKNAKEVNSREMVPGFPWPSTSCHVCFVDCQSGGEDFTCSSKANEEEALCVVSALRWFLAAGVSPGTIGVITGYAAQQAKLQRLVSELPCATSGLKIDTIDSFQGAERDLILASTVRANLAYEVGFMRDPRRVNVLLTRARCGLVVFGDTATLESESESWRPWLSWVAQQGTIITASEMYAKYKEGRANSSTSGKLGQDGVSYNVDSLSSTLPGWLHKAASRGRTPAVQPRGRQSDSPEEEIPYLQNRLETSWKKPRSREQCSADSAARRGLATSAVQSTTADASLAAASASSAEPFLPEASSQREDERSSMRRLCWSQYVDTETEQPVQATTARSSSRGWQQFLDPQTHRYWMYNEETGESCWA